MRSWLRNTKRMIELENLYYDNLSSDPTALDESKILPRVANLPGENRCGETKFEFNDEDMKIVNRPNLKKYLQFGYLDFHAIFQCRSITHTGDPVALMLNLRDPLTHDIIADHIWVRLDPFAQYNRTHNNQEKKKNRFQNMSNIINSLSVGSPVRIHGKVILYSIDTKVGVKAQYINLVKGVRTYTINSRRITD